MALSSKSLILVGQSPRGTVAGATTSGNLNSFFLYSTDDPFATVAAAGYFNGERARLRVGDQIWVSCAANKGGLYTVATVPATGNVTVVASVLV